MSLTKTQVREVRDALQSLADTEAKMYSALKGLTVTVGNASYDASTITFKVRVVAGEAGDVERIEWDAACAAVGLAAGDYGRLITYAGKPYKLVAVKPRSTQYPLIAARASDGKRFKLPLSVLGAPSPQRDLRLDRCPQCKEETMTVSFLKRGPECVEVRYKCPSCGYKDVDFID